MSQMSLNHLISLVPGERFELPTNGLQNHWRPLNKKRVTNCVAWRPPEGPTLFSPHDGRQVCEIGAKTQTQAPRSCQAVIVQLRD
jgi:hypothetical protein